MPVDHAGRTDATAGRPEATPFVNLRDPALRLRCEELFVRICAEEGHRALGWRDDLVATITAAANGESPCHAGELRRIATAMKVRQVLATIEGRPGC